MTSNLPSQSEVEWSERDNASFRNAMNGRMFCRAYFPDGVVTDELPHPIFVGQELYWFEYLNGSKLRDMTLLAVNTKFGLAWRYMRENVRNHNWIYEG